MIIYNAQLFIAAMFNITKGWVVFTWQIGLAELGI